MILEVHVKNFAVMKEAKVEFGADFNVLTGETGAGKSLLIDAILVIAGRGGSDFVRKGCECATVEAVFSANNSLKATFEEIGDDDFISLRKVIYNNGKTKQYINGNFVNQTKIRDLLNKLLHVYGQNETKDLYDEAYQRELYDIYCNNQVLIEALKDHIKEARSLSKKLNELKEKEENRLKEIDLLQFQIDEIKAAMLDDENEEEKLKEIRNQLLARDRILKNSGAVYQILYAGEVNVFDMLFQANKFVSELEKDGLPLFIETSQELKDISEMIKNRSLILKSYIEELENTENDINRIEERLDLIFKLKKKYGASIAEIKNYLQLQERRLEELKNIEIYEKQTETELNISREKLLDIAKKLTNERLANKNKFEETIRHELAELGMTKSVFKVVFKEDKFDNPEDISYKGAETIQFLFSSHSGEDPKPLGKIASGGELSRVMLAIKNTIPREDAMTIIFDEIDTGIGGKTAEILGKKLKDISKRHQVICITHLPQVAVWGSNHYKVEKVEREDRLDVEVKKLSDTEHLEEITRMLGGEKGSKGMEYAKELINKAKGAK